MATGVGGRNVAMAAVRAEIALANAADWSGGALILGRRACLACNRNSREVMVKIERVVT